MNNLQEKRLAIAEFIIQTAEVITSEVKKLPRRNKYFFKRKNIRGLSRQNKRKSKIGLFNIAMTQMMSASHIAQIAATPIPKFEKGGK